MAMLIYNLDISESLKMLWAPLLTALLYSDRVFNVYFSCLKLNFSVFVSENEEFESDCHCIVVGCVWLSQLCDDLCLMLSEDVIVGI